jgi:hypothetical protein
VLRPLRPSLILLLLHLAMSPLLLLLLLLFQVLLVLRLSAIKSLRLPGKGPDLLVQSRQLLFLL